MKYTILCVGKVKEKFFTGAIQEYIKDFHGMEKHPL